RRLKILNQTRPCTNEQGSERDWGSGGRWFESSHPDQILPVKSQHKGDTSSRSFLGQNNLEARADDQNRADAIGGVAPPGASGGRLGDWHLSTRSRRRAGLHPPRVSRVTVPHPR